MLLRRIVAPAALTFLALTASAPAIDWRVMLAPEDAASIPEPAKEAYAEAMRLNDVVALDGVVEELAKAAAAAESHVGLQFLLLNRSYNRASVYYGTANYGVPPGDMRYSSPPNMVAEPYLDLAELAIRRLSSNPNLNTEQRRRLEAQSTAVAALRAELSNRDQARAKTAFALVEAIRTDRLAYFDSKTQVEDPMDPFPAYENGINKTPETPDAPDAETASTIDPFALLPGEVINSFLPPPPAPVNNPGFGGAAPVQLDEFGNPVAAPAPVTGDPVDAAFGVGEGEGK